MVPYQTKNCNVLNQFFYVLGLSNFVPTIFNSGRLEMIYSGSHARTWDNGHEPRSLPLSYISLRICFQAQLWPTTFTKSLFCLDYLVTVLCFLKDLNRGPLNKLILLLYISYHCGKRRYDFCFCLRVGPPIVHISCSIKRVVKVSILKLFSCQKSTNHMFI